MKNRFFSVFIALLLIIPAMGVSVSAADSSYTKLLEEAAQYKIGSNGYPTREDFCIAVSKLFYPFIAVSDAKDLPFEDLSGVSPENQKSIAIAYKNGVISGVLRDGRLLANPSGGISRQDALTMLGRILNKTSDYGLPFSDTDEISGYASEYIAWFAQNGIIEAEQGSNFNPIEKVTSEELAEFIMNTYEFKRQGDATLEKYSGSGSGRLINGNRQEAEYWLPEGITAGEDGLYVFDTYNNTVRLISEDKTSTLTGVTKSYDKNRLPFGTYADNRVKSAYMTRPTSGAFNSKGELIICDAGNNRIRYIADGKMETLSGDKAGHADGKEALFNYPSALAIDENDVIYVADTLNNCIRRIGTDGEVTTIAGSPEKEGFADGKAEEALFRAPSGIAVKNGIIYVSDTGNHKIRKIENGAVKTVAGTTIATDEDGDPLGGFKDGAAETSEFNLPTGITFAGDALIIADKANNRIRVLTSAGRVQTLAGDGEPGDMNGAASGSVLCQPSGVCAADGFLYIADTGNNKIKRMSLETGILSSETEAPK